MVKPILKSTLLKKYLILGLITGAIAGGPASAIIGTLFSGKDAEIIEQQLKDAKKELQTKFSDFEIIRDEMRNIGWDLNHGRPKDPRTTEYMLLSDRLDFVERKINIQKESIKKLTDNLENAIIARQLKLAKKVIPTSAALGMSIAGAAAALASRRRKEMRTRRPTPRV